MSDLISIYYYDKNGFFVNEGVAQVFDGEPLVPNNATTLRPEFDLELFFAQFQGGEWLAVPKPRCVTDFLGLRVSHESQEPHDVELRTLIQKFANESTTHRIIRGPEAEGLWWSVEAIPEQTELEKKESRVLDLKSELSGTDYIAAKIAEGVSTRDEYAAELARRQSCRDEINRLEAEIAMLKE